ncbi:hypothetical protein D7B24_008867 [Verticillium nonalfalfae]|uniref:Exportin-1/Importin-beta-like domain-containing protein n=1 Tax=Verticillium nonalfalfae TaxID=1051616 RepID=A0A3M9Y4M8_9PEZI|nr:uncharacterized protein D7B24_008867 [Verticillium nonalfalfae]RNJ55254.1 hypothetical protein D7B24_008867 [Verticillium nonalfalfae]
MGESLSPSLQDVEALVFALYEPSSSHNVDDKIKFFGALTIMVKLNTERDNGYITAVPPEMSTILWDVDSRKLQTVLWFAGSLVEEAGKIDANASKHLGIYEAIASNISDVVALMSHCFSAGFSQTSEDRSLQGDCIKTLQSWILFSQRLAARGDETIPLLRSLIPPVLSALSIADLFEAAAELLSDTLLNYSGFLLEAHYEALFSLLLEDSARGRYQRLVDGDFDFESVQFGQLMLALGDSKVQLLIENTGDRSQDFLTRLRGLLHAQGYPISDDRIFVPALEFWSTFVETLVDCMCSDDHQAQPWVSAASSHVVELVSGIWRKVIFPPAQDFAEWDSSDRIAFGDARKDVADLLQSSFTIIGLPAALTLLFSVLPDAALAGPAAKSIQRLCSSSQQSLASESGAFLDQYSMLSTRQQIDCAASERVLGAIASVVYAIPDDQERLRDLDTLLSFVRQDLPEPDSDTELAQIFLDPGLSGSAEFFYLFALRVLDGREPLPKAAAADFWQDREAFLKKVISLRGSRATNQVVREFWLAARGSKFAYAS